MYQIVGLACDPYMSAFHYVVCHSNVTKSTFPSSLIVAEDDLYDINIKLTLHEKLERMVVTGSHYSSDGLFMFICTEEGYLFRSESRLRVPGKKEKITSCPVEMKVSFDADTSCLKFQDTHINLVDSNTFPDESCVISCIATHLFDKKKQTYLLVTGFKSGLARVKVNKCS